MENNNFSQQEMPIQENQAMQYAGTQEGVAKDKLQGVGGWLVVFAIILIFNCVAIAVVALGQLILVFEVHSLLLNNLGHYSIVLGSYVGLIGTVGELILLILGTIFLFSKNPIFPKFMGGTFIYMIAFSIILMFIAGQVPDTTIQQLGGIEELGRSLYQSIFFCTIWSSYLMKSKRVKLTYGSNLMDKG